MNENDIIIEEFEKFSNHTIPDTVLFLACDIATRYPGNYDMAKHEAYGFISGFRSAESIVTTKLLEDIMKLAESKSSSINEISNMLIKSKEDLSEVKTFPKSDDQLKDELNTCVKYYCDSYDFMSRCSYCLTESEIIKCMELCYNEIKESVDIMKEAINKMNSHFSTFNKDMKVVIETAPDLTNFKFTDDML